MDEASQKVNLSFYSKAAADMRLRIHPIVVPRPEAIDEAFSTIVAEGCDGASVFGSMLANEGAKVGASALAHRIPTMSNWAEKVPYGLLLSYGQDVYEILRKTASYVDKILKGANFPWSGPRV